MNFLPWIPVVIAVLQTSKTLGMISMQKKTQTMQGAEGVSSVPLLYENGENENTNCNSFDSQNTSLTFYPQPYKEQTMGKLASFLAGVISGAVALGVTACLVERNKNYEEDTITYTSENEKEKNDSSTAEEQLINQDENSVTALKSGKYQ